MIERLLSDQFTVRIIVACKHRIQRLIGALCKHNLKQYH
jgi:hypothetical protein